MDLCIEPYSNLKRLFRQEQQQYNPSLYNAIFNPHPYYDMLRGDIDECCEIALRYDLVVDEKRGLLTGGRNIYQDSFLNEFRVARLFERYFGKGRLNWDPPGAGASVGEFLLSTENTPEQPGIFVEVKTREKQKSTENGTLISSAFDIIGSLQKAYSKMKASSDIPSLVVLCHDHFNVAIDEFQIVKSCFGVVVFPKGYPEVISHGYFSPYSHKNLSAVGLYYYYVNPENREFKEYFEVIHNHYAKTQIAKHIFENKADKQFYLLEWDGKFTDD